MLILLLNTNFILLQSACSSVSRAKLYQVLKGLHWYSIFSASIFYGFCYSSHLTWLCWSITSCSLHFTVNQHPSITQARMRFIKISLSFPGTWHLCQNSNLDLTSSGVQHAKHYIIVFPSFVINNGLISLFIWFEDIFSSRSIDSFYFWQVLDCFSLVSVLVLSWIFLKVRYQFVHYSGVLICLAGIACLVIADYFGSRYYGPGE